VLEDYGLEAKILASASVSTSNVWPGPGLGLQQKNQQPRRDRRTMCLPTTGHHSMTEDSYCMCEREWEINLCHFNHNHINSLLYVVNHHLILIIYNFTFGLGFDLKTLASVSASRFWPRLTSLLKTSLYSLLPEATWFVQSASWPMHELVSRAANSPVTSRKTCWVTEQRYQMAWRKSNVVWIFVMAMLIVFCCFLPSALIDTAKYVA